MLVFGVAALVACNSRKGEVVIPADSDIEARVESILRKMSVEEKVGQMTQLEVSLVGNMDRSGKFVVDETKLENIIGKYKVGSLLNKPGNIPPTPAEWCAILEPIQKKSMEVLGIPCLVGLDENHGSTYVNGGTMFPQNINMAATFNRELTRKSSEITAYEARAASIPWTFCPTLDLSRDSRWPRVWENFGEDAYLNAEMGAWATLGFQGDDPNHVGAQNIAVTLKHYMGYGVPATGKDRTPSIITRQDLREKHFAPYLAGIRAGALSVMVNSGIVNGVNVHADPELLTKWLKEETGWDGMIVTDWSDINNLYTRDHVAANKKEAIKMAINAGIDMSMDPSNVDFCDLLLELVNEGEVPMSRIDDAVRRILRLKLRLGLFEEPYQKSADYPKFGGKEFAQVAVEAAEESMVLLKNSGVLPLKAGQKILVTGPNANSMRCLNGGWSYSWQGDIADLCAAEHNTIYEALVEQFGSDRVFMEQGVTYRSFGNFEAENKPEIEKAVAAARKADVIVACIGENSYCETPGNLTELALSKNQRDLVKALAATGKPLVLILNEGRPRIIADIVSEADAIVSILLPGNYGGDALANLLAGEANFSGRLPYTYPKEEQSLMTYDYKPCQQVETMSGAYNYDARVSVQWDFGYGKSYTTFAYSNLKVDKAEFNAKDLLKFTVDVTNTGAVAGKESVLLFSSDLVASISPDVRRLRDFTKVELQPGETKSVTLELKASELAFVNQYEKWTLEAGEFRIQVGSEVLSINCTDTYTWAEPNILP